MIRVRDFQERDAWVQAFTAWVRVSKPTPEQFQNAVRYADGIVIKQRKAAA